MPFWVLIHFFSQIWYDSDSLFLFIINIYILQLSKQKNNNYLFFISGLISFLPFLFKQNIGIVTIFALNLLILFLYNSKIKNKISFLFGQIFALCTFLLNLFSTNSLDDWIFYNFKYASLARFTSPITDIFPIRFISKYNYNLLFEELYYIFYLILCAICLKVFVSIFRNVNQYFFIQVLILVFSIMIYFDNYIFIEVTKFLNDFMNVNIMDLINLNYLLYFSVSLRFLVYFLLI